MTSADNSLGALGLTLGAIAVASLGAGAVYFLQPGSSSVRPKGASGTGSRKKKPKAKSAKPAAAAASAPVPAAQSSSDASPETTTLSQGKSKTAGKTEGGPGQAKARATPGAGSEAAAGQKPEAKVENKTKEKKGKKGSQKGQTQTQTQNKTSSPSSPSSETSFDQDQVQSSKPVQVIQPAVQGLTGAHGQEDEQDEWQAVPKRKGGNKGQGSSHPASDFDSHNPGAGSHTDGPSKRSRQQARTNEALKAEKAAAEADRLARLARHRREAASAEAGKDLAKRAAAQGRQALSGGMTASVSETGSLVWD